MKVFFKSSDPKALALRELTESRVRFVLRRLRGRVPRAEVRLSDLNGPRGGIDKRCQVDLRTDGAGRVVVSAISNDWRNALDDALARAQRLLARLGRREQEPRRLRPRPLTPGR